MSPFKKGRRPKLQNCIYCISSREKWQPIRKTDWNDGCYFSQRQIVRPSKTSNIAKWHGTKWPGMAIHSSSSAPDGGVLKYGYPWNHGGFPWGFPIDKQPFLMILGVPPGYGRTVPSLSVYAAGLGTCTLMVPDFDSSESWEGDPWDKIGIRRYKMIQIMTLTYDTYVIICI